MRADAENGTFPQVTKYGPRNASSFFNGIKELILLLVTAIVEIIEQLPRSRAVHFGAAAFSPSRRIRVWQFSTNLSTPFSFLIFSHLKTSSAYLFLSDDDILLLLLLTEAPMSLSGEILKTLIEAAPMRPGVRRVAPFATPASL